MLVKMEGNGASLFVDGAALFAGRQGPGTAIVTTKVLVLPMANPSWIVKVH